MNHRLLRRALAAVLCLCLLPAAALGQTPVTQSQFTLQMGLHADGFPDSTPRLRDWEAFLGKVSLQGYLNAMDFFGYSRVYMQGGAYLEEKERLPFIYDGYYTFRYFTSPAIKNESLHFQMHNFFEFMLKPYYYMGLPTQYIALFLYPEAAHYVGSGYYTPIAQALSGEGSRTVPYERLYELCETLDLLVLDDPHFGRVEMFITCLLAETYTVEATLEFLGALEDYLAFLDPQQEGMTITADENKETYVLGGTTVFEKEQAQDALSFVLNLPGPEGYLLRCQYDWAPAAQGAALAAKLTVALEGEEKLSLTVQSNGLPQGGNPQGEGAVSLTFGGSGWEAAPAPQSFAFRWHQEEEAPLALEVDWLHPGTGRPALSLSGTLATKQVEESVFVEGSYLQHDFFSLNEGFLAEYKERYASTLALAMVPFLLEMPAGVLDDIVEFASETGILDSLGL